MKNNKKLITIIFIQFIVFFIMVPLLINLLYKIETSNVWLQSEWSAGELLSFYGTILGLSISTLSVVYTISTQEKSSAKDDSIKYKPIIKAIGSNDAPIDLHRELIMNYSVSHDNGAHVEKDFPMLYETRDRVLIYQNVGRGETSTGLLSGLTVKSVSWDEDTHLGSGISQQYIGEITKEGYFSIILKLPKYLFLDSDNTEFNDLTLYFDIDYSDMFNREKYRTRTHLNIKVEFIKEVNTKIKYKNGYTFSEVDYKITQVMPSKYIFSKEKKEYLMVSDYFRDNN